MRHKLYISMSKKFFRNRERINDNCSQDCQCCRFPTIVWSDKNVNVLIKLKRHVVEGTRVSELKV